MPSPIISIELRKEWRAISNDTILNMLQSKGVHATLNNSRNRHFKITGESREVELYATTGTVNAAPHNQMGASIARGMSPKRALERAVTLSKLGY